jgi:hypothetical protein
MGDLESGFITKDAENCNKQITPFCPPCNSGKRQGLAGPQAQGGVMEFQARDLEARERGCGWRAPK